jgi:hypothetical protein
MGFALWINDDLAWAQGTHEYRPMGVAVVGAEGTFAARDFSRRRRVPPYLRPHFAGFFASIGEMNEHLEARVKRGKWRTKPRDWGIRLLID